MIPRNMDPLFLYILIHIIISIASSKRLYSEENFYIGYDFEKASDIDHIDASRKSFTLDNETAKHRSNSLLWIWNVNELLSIDLQEQRQIFKNKRQPCGLHFWLYQSKPIKSHLHLVLTNAKREKFEFRINLDFVGWRAVARTFAITKYRRFLNPNHLIMYVENEDPFIKSGAINVDILRLSSRCIGWTYDYINTPQIPLPFGMRNEIGGIDDLNGVYEVNHFWQSMYKWRKIDEFYNTKIDATSPLTTEENNLTKELNKIEARIDDWYFPNDQNPESFSTISKLKFQSLKHCMNSRSNFSMSFSKWLRNLKYGNFPFIRRSVFASPNTKHEICFDSAHAKLKRINKLRKWPSLYPSRDVMPYGKKGWQGMKFNEVTGRIIFPLALEFFISRRNGHRRASIKKALISKEHLKNFIEEELHSNISMDKWLGRKRNIRKIYKSIDHLKLKTIRKLLNHIQKQGWIDGSGLGNADHLINLNAGFTHTIYLVKKNLKNAEFFRRLINTGRWYNEIGELHQQHYEHAGSTADKIRNLVMNRLLTIIASPEHTTKEARQKINDAFNLKRWIENSLKINEGYAGLIKPDFTGFHHKGAYMSAYIPQALHALSLSAYFLHGTSFAIDKSYLKNLENALNTLHAVSNNYGVPASVSGAKIDLGMNLMSNMVPSFAYLTLASADNNGQINTKLAKTFLSIYKPSDEYIKHSLIEGNPSNQGSQYFNTIGSLTLMEKLEKLINKKNIKKGNLPNGHWVFPYAGLSVHRRKNYTVTVKGFNKYIWDYESSIDQNVFGRYFSHGFLSVSNGKKSLSTLDYFHGFDWTKIPGATTVHLKLNQLLSTDKCRYFSNTTLLGGLVFGKRKARNGLFAFDFNQPKYIDKFYKENHSEFSFRKSFIFIDGMIIALGSAISKTGLPKSDVFTTLFQNKLSANKNIILNGSVYTESPKIRKRWNTSDVLTAVDSDNNGYFIPQKHNQKIIFKIGKNKDARKPNGMKVTSPGTYGSLVINHGSLPRQQKYEYVVLIDSGREKIEKFKQVMLRPNIGHFVKPYNVLQHDDIAHVVSIVKTEGVEIRYKLTTYTIFDSKKFHGDENMGLIKRVSRPCVIAVKEKERRVHISISDPDLNMFQNYLLYSKFIQRELMYNSYSKPSFLKVNFNRDLRLNAAKNSNKTLEDSVSPIYYESNDFGGITPTIQMSMSHGLTTELKLTYV